jgi:hypothetical protein
MSEAMTNPEIEDVLASIRRLVAQDRRPRPERLLLTEEFRVRQANIPAPPQFPQAPAGAPESAPSAAPALGEVSAEMVRAARLEPEAPPPPAAPPPADRSALAAVLDELEARIPPAAAPEAPTERRAAAPASEQAPEFAARPGSGADAPPDPSAGPTATSGEIVGDDVAFIDEDDLRQLVARIVREELRGQLGERITAQVRKLVRAEIARALDERNLLG